MLQFLLTYDGKGMVIFTQNDILNIRMTLLYGWLTGGDFKIDVKGLLGVDAGIKFLFHKWLIFFLFLLRHIVLYFAVFLFLIILLCRTNSSHRGG